ncbi:trichoplein keratin filament-binding protein-like isoform X3 [Osmia bicornis bicornis]|uniref:trichoplein keratin filament-binding protein-like isoform X3 n=1 Tax=Osmia bicornis bicornis TaxID=1437191 RepID=UPI001EAEA644|nr:trichoplein keratin filament-binding protein-like isoform X3 [Osmia bicornis bicornis]
MRGPVRLAFSLISLVSRKVSRYREKQYQLAAQRHNQEFLKYDHYQQIAKYYEQQCRIAKQYDSWNSRGIDPKGELAKAKKAERLLVRRNKLRNLLKEEDESYRNELEEQKILKNRSEVPSLEQLKRKLKEKRAEESLYFPRTCRRYQSYFVCPKESNSSGSSTLRDTNLQYSRVCRDSTNLIHQNGQNSRCSSSGMSKGSNRKSQEQENFDTRKEVHRRASLQFSNEVVRPNTRYSARYARRSLENTNVRSDDSTDYGSNRVSSRSSFGAPSETYLSLNSKTPLRKNDKENALLSPQEVRVIKNRSYSRMGDPEMNTKDLAHQKESPHRRSQDNDNTELNQSMEDQTETPIEDPHQKRDLQDKYSSEEDHIVEDVKTTDNRQFEVEKSMPWLRMDPTDKNLSKQMFLYLTHKELKTKIEDLIVRESHACKKQCWDEALRLRDMRNRLELHREKKLYSIDNIVFDEETKKLALMSIDKRENELAEREDACTDSTMYSEDAKALWKKWVHEDERFVIEDARVQREKLMNVLEKEWQGLAIRDKERITRSHQTVIHDAVVQEEHKLMSSLNAAKAKSSPTSLK